MSNWRVLGALGLSLLPALAAATASDAVSPSRGDVTAESSAATTTTPGTEPDLRTIPVDAPADGDQVEAATPRRLRNDPPTRLDDIIVTATKRPEPLRRLPASIFALDGQQLEDSGAIEMRDFLALDPGVSFSELQPELFRVSIRGIQADVSALTPQTAGIFIDDVPFNDPFLNQVRPDLLPFDLEGIEVLKGPQGTLFGGSGLAGAIRYKLAAAAPGEWQSRGFFQYQWVTDGSPDRIGGAATNIPIGGDAALRLVGVRRLTGGVIDDTRNHETDTDRTQNFSGRALLRWNLSGNLSVGLKAFEQHAYADDLPWAETNDGRLERSKVLRKSPSRTIFNFYSLDFDYRMPWAELVSTSTLLHKFGDLKNAYIERTLGVQDLGQPVDDPTTADIDGVVQEIRLLSVDDPGSPWRWLAGAFAQHYASFSTQRIFTTIPLAGVEVPLLDFSADVRARELALFGEVSRNLGERWKLTVGMRGYQVRTEGMTHSSGLLIVSQGSASNSNNDSVRSSGINPKAALQFTASENISTYASVSRGFRFGGIQLFGPSATSPNVPRTYSPDRIWNYELGLRTQWFGATLQADGAVFHIDWKDPQVQTTTGGAVPINLIENVGGARSSGAELALRYAPPDSGFDLALSWAYTRARTTAPFTAPSGATVPAGSRLPGSASVQAAGILDYQLPVGANTFVATLTHVIQGDGVSDILQSMKIYDYQTTDLRLAWHNAALWGLPRLTLAMINLTDERAVVSAFVASSTNFTTIYNRPRTLEARLDLQF